MSLHATDLAGEPFSEIRGIKEKVTVEGYAINRAS